MYETHIEEPERKALEELCANYEHYLMDDGTFEDNPIQVVKGHVLKM